MVALFPPFPVFAFDRWLALQHERLTPGDRGIRDETNMIIGTGAEADSGGAEGG